MDSSIHFYVYRHVFILKDNRKIIRFFITLRDCNKNIIAFTDFHKYIKVGNNSKSVKVTSSGEVKFYAVCKFLNHVFFESAYKPNSLNDITKEMVSTYLNDYGLARLPGDTETRKQTTVDVTISAVLDFLDAYILEAGKKKIYTKLKRSDLYVTEKRFSKKNRKFVFITVPAFKVVTISKEKDIFRDIFEGAYSILMNTIIEQDMDLLMLAALSSFAGLRPSEACNVFREDSPLGEGIRFIEYNGKVDDIIIDLSYERPLRSDGVSVGNIKKERMQRVYPAFLQAFMECYEKYMKHMEKRKCEVEFAPLSVNKQGKAMTYDNYYSRFKTIVDIARKKMLADDDPKVVAFGKQLSYTNLGPHIFRHWFSVKLTLFGEDVAGLMYWRGDRSPQSAMTYIGNKSELVKQLEDVTSEMYDYHMWMAEKKHENRP